MAGLPLPTPYVQLYQRVHLRTISNKATATITGLIGYLRARKSSTPSFSCQHVMPGGGSTANICSSFFSREALCMISSKRKHEQFTAPHERLVGVYWKRKEATMKRPQRLAFSARLQFNEEQILSAFLSQREPDFSISA